MAQNDESLRTEFAVFCIENTAELLKMSGRDIVNELEKTDGVRSFLYPSYDVLHTQGKDYIVSEALFYIRRNNPTFGTKGASA